MSVMRPEWIEKIYAGWLAKIIGIRLGAPVENWSYEKIKRLYGAPERYLVDYRRFAADDDSNGPLFFLRALEDSDRSADTLCAEDVGEALLNYVPFEHGFFWWGGYGHSTEHTAYLNLCAGIPAPRSGSIQQNGQAIAEQIGGQIFIDTWGLVSPGQPSLAAQLARKAASVTHDGEGINGGVFVAVCISFAFVEQDILTILKKGLSYLSEESQYKKVVEAVICFYHEHPQDWEECLFYIQKNYGYDRYPGSCHIIPNTAVMILALLYGEGDFSRTLTICNRCGWDTDCNVGNIATIMGVRGGLPVIGDVWRKPINDFLACSSVVGSLNIQDIPYGACYIAKIAWYLAGELLPEPYRDIIEKRIHSCHFEFPGSTHGIEVRREEPAGVSCQALEVSLQNTAETARTGLRSLRVVVKPVLAGEQICIYQRCYLRPEDFHDSRYDPAFSPLIYPGQTLHGSMLRQRGTLACSVSLYVRESRSGHLYTGEPQRLYDDVWTDLIYKIPKIDGALFDEAGFLLEPLVSSDYQNACTVLIDDFYADGQPNYSIEFARENIEIWNGLHQEISQFTRLKGNSYLACGEVHLSCSDFGEIYSGRYDWTDYQANFVITPITGKHHYVCVRVQGASRAYLAGLSLEGLQILKKKRTGLQILASVPFHWQVSKTYLITVTVCGSSISVRVGGVLVCAMDSDMPYCQGGIGLAVRQGSHMSCAKINIQGMVASGIVPEGYK